MAPMYQLHVAEPDRISVAQPTDYIEQDQMSFIQSSGQKDHCQISSSASA